jgi:TRAP-type C4-dicarboxylate transport system substrate-binding protein
MMGWQAAVKAVLALAEQKSQGRLKFKILGGAEVIPSQEQFEAVRSGVADSVWGPTGYFIGTAPAGEAMFLDMATAKDRRASGLEDLFNQYYQTKGHYYLMMIDPSSFKEGMYGMFVNGNITKLDDLKGVKIRATGSFAPWVKAFGGVPVNIPSGEIYTAAQSGIVAGCTQPADEQFYNRALYEVIKGYIWPFVGKNPLIWSMNLNKWNALPADIQKIIKDSIIEIENDPVWVKTMYDFHVGWDAKFQAKGMKKFDFGPEAQTKVRDAFAAGIWDSVMKGDAVWGAKLKAIIDAQPK